MVCPLGRRMLRHAPAFRYLTFLHIPRQRGKEMANSRGLGLGVRVSPESLTPGPEAQAFTNVTAPCDAEETSAAYLENTPRL
jgi:hypothetical protein